MLNYENFLWERGENQNPITPHVFLALFVIRRCVFIKVYRLFPLIQYKM